MPNACICKLINDGAYDLQNTTGHVRCASVAGIRLLMPLEYIVSMLPVIKVFRWAWKYINDPSLIPDLKGQNSSIDKNVYTKKHKNCL